MRQLFACHRIETVRSHIAQDFVERHAMKTIEIRPWHLAAAHPVHRWHVESPPGVCQPLPVTVDASMLTNASRFGDYTRAPVDRGAEDIERQSAYRAEIGRSQIRNTIRAHEVWLVRA